MKDITTEEAIQIMRNHICWIENKKVKQAIEKVLNELNDYNEGKIVSLKLLEKFNLISRDEKNQHSIANEDFFEKYVPKDIVEKKDKIINAMAEYISNSDNDEIICKATKCEDEVMSKEAFNEIIDNLEYIGTLTDYGKKGIKYNVKKLQEELQQEKEKGKNFGNDYINKERIKEILDPYKRVKIPGMRDVIEEIEEEIKKC